MFILKGSNEGICNDSITYPKVLACIEWNSFIQINGVDLAILKRCKLLLVNKVGCFFPAIP